MLLGWPNAQYQVPSELSTFCRAALTAINILPGIIITKLIIDTDIPDKRLSNVSEMCHALKNTQCMLRFETRVDSNGYIYVEKVPKIHYTALSMFLEHRWKLCGKYEVVDNVDPSPDGVAAGIAQKYMSFLLNLLARSSAPYLQLHSDSKRKGERILCPVHSHFGSAPFGVYHTGIP